LLDKLLWLGFFIWGKMEFVIDEKFKNLLIPLTEQESDGLEESILSEGCRVPLDVWNGVLIDGHNRFEICQRHGIEYRTNDIKLNTRADAEMWIVKNQLARRNLTPFQKAELALKAKPAIEEQAREKQKEHGNTAPGKPKSLCQNSDKVIDTKKQIATLAGVSHDRASHSARLAALAAALLTRTSRRPGLPASV
jgi:hypothetical protein